MNVILIYYSLTGTTEEFAGRIANGLIKEKNLVKLFKIETDVKVTEPRQDFKILNLPECSKFDLVLFGGPVWAFSACPVIIEAINKSGGLSGKKVIPFVTMGLPFKFMGGFRAINQMTKAATAMGASVLPGIIIPKLFHDFRKLMDKAVIDIIASIRNA